MQGELGKRLRLIRAERKLSLRQAAREAGLAKETLGDVERGKRQPSDVTLAKLAEVYDVPLQDLFDLEEEDERAKTEEPASPLGQAPSTSGRVLKGDEARRWDFIGYCSGYAITRARYYERRLAKAELEGSASVLALFDDILVEYDNLGELFVNDLAVLWMASEPPQGFNDEIDDEIEFKALIARAIKPMADVIERISNREFDLGMNEDQQKAAEERRAMFEVIQGRLGA